MEWIIALLTLTFLEIVLGIDNIIFISILTNRLPESQKKKGTDYRSYTCALFSE